LASSTGAIDEAVLVDGVDACVEVELALT
jgi:hypothetical protein